jgi:predicted dehydrogenase
MSNQGIHEIDRLQEILGIPNRVRAGIATQTHSIEAEDIGWSEWIYENGCIARFSATTSYPVSAWYSRIEIHGTGGACVHTVGGPEGRHNWWAQADGEWTEEAPYPFKRRWRCASENFANSIRTGVPLSISGVAGRKSRLVLDALYESAKSDGEWIEIKS